MNEDLKKNWKKHLGMLGALWLLLFVFSTVVTTLGGRHMEEGTSWTWEMRVSCYDYIVALMAYTLGIFGLGRDAIIQLRGTNGRPMKERVMLGVTCAAGIVLCSVALCHEFSVLCNAGYTPDPLKRTVMITFGVLMAIGYAFRDVLPDPDKENHEEKPEPHAVGVEGRSGEAQPLSMSSWIVLTVLGLLFVWMIYGTLRDQITYMFADKTQEVAPQPSVEAPAQTAVKVSPPASFDELSKAFVCVCLEDKRPCGSGLLVGFHEHDSRRVMMVTAAHVGAAAAGSVKGEPVVNLLLSNSIAESDAYHSIKGNDIKWIAPTNGTDLAVLDLTDEFAKIVAEGVDVRYVSMSTYPIPVDDPFAITGVAVLPRAWLPACGIGLGTNVRVMGMGSEIWAASRGKKRQPLALRAGLISTRLDYFDDELGEKSPVGPITIESGVRPGFSGGPVFAYSRVGASTYPVLIGVVRSVLNAQNEGQIIQGLVVTPKALSGYAQVTPLDALLKSNSPQLAMIAPEAKGPTPAQRDGVPHAPLAAFDFEIKKGGTVINPPFFRERQLLFSSAKLVVLPTNGRMALQKRKRPLS